MRASIILGLCCLLLATTISQACLEDFNNSCKSNADCCSGRCSNNYGTWEFGVCKPTKKCKPLYFNRCRVNNECCSGFCDRNNGQWKFGVCR